MQIGIVKHGTNRTFFRGVVNHIVNTACRLDKSGSAGRRKILGDLNEPFTWTMLRSLA